MKIKSVGKTRVKRVRPLREYFITYNIKRRDSVVGYNKADVLASFKKQTKRKTHNVRKVWVEKVQEGERLVG